MKRDEHNGNDESFENLVDFFDLLIKVDQRINPDLYKENKPLEKGNSENKKKLE